MLGQIQQVIPALRPIELLVGLAALQNDEDRQDPHSAGALPVSGATADRGHRAVGAAAEPALAEGIGDNVVSNNATRAAARELGIPQVERVKRASPGSRAGARAARGQHQRHAHGGPLPVRARADAQLRRGRELLEGHHCPQRATEARQQILNFFSTALAGGAPQIIDPLP